MALTMQQMTGNPFLPGDPFTTPLPPMLPQSRAVIEPKVAQPDPNTLTPEEIHEAQELGILPGPQNNVGPAIPPALDPANLGQAPGRQPPVAGPSGSSGAFIARRQGVVGPDTVPRVQLTPPNAQPSPLSMTLAARRESLNKDLERTTQTPDYTGLSNQMRNRSAIGMDNMYAAALAGLGPEATRGFQEPLLKEALAANSPMKVEGGMIGPQGEVMIDPGFQNAKRADMLRNRLAQLDTLEARAVSDQDRTAIAHERNMILMLVGQLRAASSGGQNNAQTWGFTPDGRRIVEDRNGSQWAENPDGSRVRYTGVGTQRAPFEKNVQTSMTLQGSISRADNLLELAKQNAKAFGLVPAVVSLTPDLVQQRVMPKVLTPEQQTARNYIMRQAAQEIHDIYGAALTMGEGQRAASWAIGPRDSADTVLSKLQSARDWAAQSLSAQGTAPNAVAASRTGGAQPQPQGAPQVPGLPAGWTVKEKRPNG